MKDALIRLYNKLTDNSKSFDFIDVKTFCEVHGNKYEKLADEQECEELRPCIWKIRENSEKIPRILPETYIAEIEDATVFGENELVASKGMILSDVFASKYADKMHLTKKIVNKIDFEKRRTVLKYHNYRRLPVKEAFNLVGMFTYNYYHFILNTLPKLYYLYQREEYKTYPLLMDRRAYQNFKSIIDRFNIHNRAIICVGSDVALKVKRLVIASNSSWYDKYVLEEYFKDIGHVYDKCAIQFVRNYVLADVKPCGGMKRVYVSRRNVDEGRKRLEREEEVEALFNKYGFVSVCPEELSFFEQVKLFSQTEVFAGVAGAAFTNIIFLPENATVIYATCLHGNRGENLYPTLWNTVGKGKFILLQGEETEESKQLQLKDNLKKFKLNMQQVEELLISL